MTAKKPGFATKTIHLEPRTPAVPSAPLPPPLALTASFSFESFADVEQALGAPFDSFVYSRLKNPTVDMLERAVADLEGAELGLAFASGMAAIHAALVGQLSAGDHAIFPRVVYGGTYALVTRTLPRLGIETSLVDYDDPDAMRAAVRPTTRVVWAETLTNPTVQVADFAFLREFTARAGARLVVDSTFATPWLCRPLEHGADLVIHSASKYLGGHGDLLGGLVVGPNDLVGSIRREAIQIGGAMSPFVAWLVLRGLKTLALRMAQHCTSAKRVAQTLAAHPRVDRVYYPGLSSDAHYDAARTLFDHDAFGAIVSMELRGSIEHTRRRIEALNLFKWAGSLGDTHSLVLLPALGSHRTFSPRARAEAGISEKLVRLSVGLEDVEDLVADLEQALAVDE